MKIIDYVAKMFQDDAGNPSSMRLIAVGVPVVMLFMWTKVCLETGTLVSFSWPDMVTMLGPSGIKAFQKGKETTKPKGDIG